VSSRPRLFVYCGAYAERDIVVGVPDRLEFRRPDSIPAEVSFCNMYKVRGLDSSNFEASVALPAVREVNKYVNL